MASSALDPTSHRSRRQTPMPLVYRYLGDKRFAYTLPRALSLQILHPGNAASLVEHVHGGLWAHKSRAVGQMVYIAYSNRDLRSVMRTAHSHVKGVDSAGVRYHSLNPELFFYQHATYLDALYTSIDLFHGGIGNAEKEQLYRECKLWYAKYDISDRAQPDTYREFVDYFEDFVSTKLRMSPEAGQLLEETLNPPTWYPRRVPPAAIRAMLHPRAAELLGIKPSTGDRIALKTFVKRTNVRLALTPNPYEMMASARHNPDD